MSFCNLKSFKITTNYIIYIKNVCSQMNTQNNVSSRVAMDSFRFERKPPITLQTGRYATANLRKNEGFVIFRYRPRDNATTMFYIRACGACMKAKFRGPDYSRVRFPTYTYFKFLKLPL